MYAGSPCHGLVVRHEAVCGISWMPCTYVCVQVCLPNPWETPQGAASIPWLGKSWGYQAPAVTLFPRGVVGCLLGLLRGVSGTLFASRSC